MLFGLIINRLKFFETIAQIKNFGLDRIAFGDHGFKSVHFVLQKVNPARDGYEQT
jgi:hypothetical protein